MASQMVLKCSKTGRLFFSAAEATEHAEAFGAAYANFDEVSVDSKCYVCVETGRRAFTEDEMAKLKARDPDSKTWEEKTIAYVMELQKNKDKVAARKDRFLDSVDQKKLLQMTEVKSLNRIKAAKALHFTKDGAATLESAEKWLEAHKDDEGLDKLSDEFLDSVFGGQDVVMGDGDVEMADAEVVDDRKLGDPNPPEVKEAVTRSLVTEIMEMGFTELRAEKALFKTDNASLEHAMNWLADHAEDADIDLPLPRPGIIAPPKPKMSKEEAAQKVQELQQRLRVKRAAEEKESEKEKERMRVESMKNMIESSARLKEEERKRAIEQQLREKEEAAAHRAQLKEQLRLDYIERFGCEPPAEEEEDVQKIKEMTSKDKVVFYISKLKKGYKDSDREGLKTCLSTLKIYIKNLYENPQDVKFKKLKLENKAFQSRVAPFEGSMELLDVLGFEKKDDCLEQRKSVPDGFLCSNALKFLDLLIGQL